MTIGPEDWEPQEPSVDFADRVMTRVRDEADESRTERRVPRRQSVRVGVAGGLALAAAVALAIGWRGAGHTAHGDASATAREEVRLGGRAIAVLEPGAHVTWSGDDVNQPTGDVFYRVEPGGAFRVHTPAGDVQVLGTCFRVQVESPEKAMNGRDVKVLSVGAALGAAAFVSVYEGRVALSRASERVTLTAGESARADGAGIARVGGGAAASVDGAAAATSTDDPLVAANANLADSVREYKRRLESIEEEKATIAKQLTLAQAKLAAEQNGDQVVTQKNPYDLSQDDWKELAKEGKVMARTPCTDPSTWTPSPAQLAKTGLAPSDAQPIHDVLQQSAQRVWAVIRPLCIQALQGDAKIADKLGVGTCTSLVGDVARINNEDTEEEMRAVAEMRAGQRPYDAKALGTYGQILYAESGESKAMEAQLAQSIGPTDAHAFVYGDEGCWSSSAWSVGPRPTLPPQGGQRVVTGATSP